MYLAINMAVADIFVGGCTEIKEFVDLGESCFLWITRNPPSFADICILFLFPAASLTNLAAISLERTHATFRPFRHRIIKKWVYGFIILIIWVTSGLLLVVLYYSENYNYIWSLFNGFCLFVVCVSYVSIFVKISCGAHSQHHYAASRERKLTKTLFIVTVVSLLMWLPITIWLLPYTTLHFSSGHVSFHLHSTFVALFYANSLVNPILYAIRMPEYKRALVSLFRRQPRRVEIISLEPM